MSRMTTSKLGHSAPENCLSACMMRAWILRRFGCRSWYEKHAIIDVDHDGCIELEWRLSAESEGSDPDDAYWGNGEGIAVLRFYPSYLNSLSILSGSYASGKRRLTSEGCLSQVKTPKAIDMFAERFLSEGE